MIKQLAAMTLILPYLLFCGIARFFEDSASLLAGVIDKLVDEDEADLDSSR